MLKGRLESPKVIGSSEEFTIIGENIHATRVVLRNGRRALTLDDGVEAVRYKGEFGDNRHLRLPDWFKKTQAYEQGQIKHFLIAMMNGIGDDSSAKAEATDYVQQEVRRQAAAGATYLDINVDEVHYDLETQMKCMRWAVDTVQEVSPVPPSIDSSKTEIIAAGLEVYDGRVGRPLVNSIALERLDALDLAMEHNARIIVMATSATGMPQSHTERTENVKAIMEHVQAKGVALNDVFVDGVIFPISVDSVNGTHYFDAVRAIREEFGDEIHIGGGLSNVSFGMPRRKLINDVFIYLGLDAGIDSGIMDPVQTRLSCVMGMDTDSEPVTLAMNMLLGQDDFCMNYIHAFRDGRLG